MDTDIEMQKLFIDIAGNTIQVLAIILGIWIAAYQIRKGYENNLNLQKENIKNEHFSKLHGEIEKVVENLFETTADFNSSLRSITSAFQFYRISLQAGIHNPSVSIDSTQEFSDKRYALNKAIIHLISTVEKYEIVEPRIKIFQTAFNVASYDLAQAFIPLHAGLVTVLPSIEIPGRSIPFRLPSAEHEKSITNHINRCLDATSDIGCYTYDLRVEIQNLLLSDLFERKLERRKPVDEKFRVISTEAEDYEKLIKYFENETEWGKDNQLSEARVREQINQCDDNHSLN